MKKVIRLTEDDLVRLVKKVIKEQAAPVGSGGNVWSMLKKAIEGPGTDEVGVKRACSMVTSPDVYKQVLAFANKEGHKTVMDYIMSDFGTYGIDQPVQTMRTVNKGSGWDTEGYSKDVDTQTTKFCSTTLSRFNRNEMGSFGKGTRLDMPV